MVFIASLLGAQQNRDSVENKAASLLVVSLGKTINGMPLSLCGRQVVGSCSQQIAQTSKEKKKIYDKKFKMMSSYLQKGYIHLQIG